jgi:hypothetical protein
MIGHRVRELTYNCYATRRLLLEDATAAEAAAPAPRAPRRLAEGTAIAYTNYTAPVLWRRLYGELSLAASGAFERAFGAAIAASPYRAVLPGAAVAALMLSGARVGPSPSLLKETKCLQSNVFPTTSSPTSRTTPPKLELLGTDRPKFAVSTYPSTPIDR